MRLRRSNSTPSDTRPATSRRGTLDARRKMPGRRHGAGERPEVGAPPSPMSSTVRPTRYGMSTPALIASAASTSDAITPRR